MSKVYTFSIQMCGTIEAWLEADSEAEAWAMVKNKDWDDSDVMEYQPFPETAVLIHVGET